MAVPVVGIDVIERLDVIVDGIEEAVDVVGIEELPEVDANEAVVERVVLLLGGLITPF